MQPNRNDYDGLLERDSIYTVNNVIKCATVWSWCVYIHHKKLYNPRFEKNTCFRYYMSVLWMTYIRYLYIGYLQQSYTVAHVAHA